MDTHIERIGKIALVGLMLLILLQASLASTDADSFSPPTYNTTANAYGTVGPSLYEAECATHLPNAAAWTFRKAARASSLPNPLPSNDKCQNPPYSGKNYIESRSATSKVCLDFQNADRVGFSYVAGDYKGKALAVVTLADGTTITKHPNMFLEYTDPPASSNSSDFDENFQEGDLDGSNAAGGTLTFHAFKWVWEQDDSLSNKSGKICVNPKNAKDADSHDTMVSIDYFVVARGKPKAIRGIGTGTTNLTQDDVNATWNYDVRNFKFPNESAPTIPLAPHNPANWKGFIPKLSGGNSTVSFAKVLDVITATKAYGDDNVPKYWIQYNEEDNAGYFDTDSNGPEPGNQPYPESTFLSDILISNIINVTNAYTATGLVPPKFIITIGSQYHAPSKSNLLVAGDWSLQSNTTCSNPDYQQNWGCTHLTSVWIHDFWMAAKPRLEQRGLLQYIGGFSGHFYQDGYTNHNCDTPTCRIDPSKVTDFAEAMNNWATQYSGIANPEIWIVETSTSLPFNCGATPFVRQRDLFLCAADTKKYNVRNYVGYLQNALAKQVIVNRWACFADRWGGINLCDGLPGTGDENALNELCHPTAEYPTGIKRSPYGNNHFVGAAYR